MTVFNTRIRRIARRALAALAAVACTMSLAACGADESGKIRIGIKFDQPGLGFKKSGTYVGFDVDVPKYVAKKLGYSEDEIVWKEAPSKQREAMLQNGDVDMILATYSITDERKNAVSFAGPYFVAGQDLLVRKDDHSINGPEDLNGKRLCSVTGSTSAATVKEKFASEVQLMEQPGYAECATALFSASWTRSPPTTSSSPASPPPRAASCASSASRSRRNTTAWASRRATRRSPRRSTPPSPR